MKSVICNSGGSKGVHCFYGTATVGERGQLVIPSEARAELGINPGDKLLVMKHPLHDGLMVFKIEAAQEFLAEVQACFARMQEQEADRAVIEEEVTK